MRIRREKIFVLTVLSLLVLQVLVVLLSWIISTAMPELAFNSLLSSKGIRWFWSSMLDNIGNDHLSSLLLLAISIGSLVWSGFPKKIIRPSSCDFQERFAMKVFFAEIFLFGFLIAYVLLRPHSPFLAIDGSLVNGPVWSCIIPAFSLMLLICSESYAFFIGKLNSYKNAEKSLIFGLQYAAPLIVIWFQVKELFQTLLFFLF